MMSLYGQHSVRFSSDTDSSVWPGKEAQAAGLEPAGPSRDHYDNVVLEDGVNFSSLYPRGRIGKLPFYRQNPGL